MVCQGGGYEVADGTNYNFSSDFSIAMTFAASDVNTDAGSRLQGHGLQQHRHPRSDMSYRVARAQRRGHARRLTDGDGNDQHASSPDRPSQPNTFYQVIVVKQTTTPRPPGRTRRSTDPYDAAIRSHSGLCQLRDCRRSGTIGTADVGQRRSTSATSRDDNGPTPQLNNFLDNLQHSAGEPELHRRHLGAGR